jgi:hypothetical protein
VTARARERLKSLGEYVNVLTAGDKDVCQICEDLAADGPYSLEEAEAILGLRSRPTTAVRARA